MNTWRTLDRHDELSETPEPGKSSVGHIDRHKIANTTTIADDHFRAALNIQIDRLESALREQLECSSEAISEFDLMQQLSAPPHIILSAAARRSSLGLFQSHFLLFHTLYGIRQKTGLSIAEEKPTRDLCIHPLHIGYITPETPSTGERRDPATGQQRAGLPLADCVTHMAGSGAALADYYLELDNLYKTSANDVNALISGFWKLFRLAEAR